MPQIFVASPGGTRYHTIRPDSQFTSAWGMMYQKTLCNMQIPLGLSKRGYITWVKPPSLFQPCLRCQKAKSKKRGKQ